MNMAWAWIAFAMAMALFPATLWVHRAAPPFPNARKRKGAAWATAASGFVIQTTRAILLLTPVRAVAPKALPIDLPGGDELIRLFITCELVLLALYLNWAWAFIGRKRDARIASALYGLALLAETAVIGWLLAGAADFE